MSEVLADLARFTPVPFSERGAPTVVATLIIACLFTGADTGGRFTHGQYLGIKSAEVDALTHAVADAMERTAEPTNTRTAGWGNTEGE